MSPCLRRPVDESDIRILPLDAAGGPHRKRGGSPGLAGYPGADERVKETAERMWHSGTAAKYAVYGKGRVFNDGCSLEEVFASLSMRPPEFR